MTPRKSQERPTTADSKSSLFCFDTRLPEMATFFCVMKKTAGCGASRGTSENPGTAKTISDFVFFFAWNFLYLHSQNKDMQDTAIHPIVNGGVNPNLTPELFKDLDKSTKRQVIWSIVVSMGFAHSFPEVDRKVFEPSEFKLDYKDLTYDGPDGELDLDKLFVTVREEFQNHHRKMKAKTADLHYELGRKIFETQKELGFGGMLELSRYRLKGYISACGDWNDFNAAKVGVAIDRMHELAPRRSYGPNNPNTGSVMHKLKSVTGCEYVIMDFDFVQKEDLERIREFYKNQWEPKGESITADSIRIEETDHGHGYYGAELIWWWD